MPTSEAIHPSRVHAERGQQFPKGKRVQDFLARLVAAIGDQVNRRPVLSAVFILLITVPLALVKAHTVLPLSDEVYTIRIAELPTVAEMLRVSRAIDMHPPLHFLAERVAIYSPLPLWLSARLPSLLVMLVMLLVLFRIVARRAGNLMAAFAVAVFWMTPGIEFAWFDRPYALWLFFLCLCILCWQNINASRHARLWVLALALAGCGMTLTHMLGVACLLPIALAEFVRGRRTERLRPEVYGALVLPCLAVALYLRQLHDFSHNSFVPRYLQASGVLADTYLDLLQQAVGVFGACLVAAALLYWRAPKSAEQGASFAAELPSSQSSGSLPREEIVLGFGLALLPVLLAIAASLRHTQFLTRYGACADVGLALMAPWLLLRLTAHPRTIATLVVISTLITAGVTTSSARQNPSGPWRSFLPMGITPPTLAQLDPSLPIAVANPLSYTEANERESPALLQRMYYVDDRAMAEKFSGTTVLEDQPTAVRLLGLSTQTAPYRKFLAEHPRFYVIGNYDDPEAWLLRGLESCGASLQYLGKFQSTYVGDDLYLVTPSPACGR